MNDFDATAPLYLQLCEELRKRILNHEFEPNHKVGSVRDLSFEYGVNPNTVQRALHQLEDEGFIQTEKNQGRRVCLSEEKVTQLKEERTQQTVELFLAKMKELGYDASACEILIRNLGNKR